jgi:putative cell wall-binding protein
VGEGYGGSGGGFTNAGTLVLPNAATLIVPSSVTGKKSATNSGTIKNSGTITGGGTIVNPGTILNSGNVQSGGTGTPSGTLLVTKHNYKLSFNLNGEQGTKPAPLRVFAATVAASQQSLPTSPSGSGWYTKPSGGTHVSDTTDLSASSLGGDGPSSLTLYAAAAPPPPPPPPPVIGPLPPRFAGPISGLDSATSNDPHGTATASQGCLSATGYGEGTLTVATYVGNPVGEPSYHATGAFVDVQTSPDSTFTKIVVSCTLSAGGNTISWWDGSAWKKVDPQSYDAAGPTVTFTITAGSSPSLAQLKNTVFGIGTLAMLTREGGSDRVATAIAVSKATYAAGSAGAVVLARQDRYPDALSGGPLAVAENAPLLLTRPHRLDAATRAEIRRVLPEGGTVYLLGGTAALSDAVAAAVEDLGDAVRRVGGANRYQTAVDIAGLLSNPKAIFVGTGLDFADALAASAAAAHTHGVVVLTHGDRMNKATAAYLAAHPHTTSYAIGGPAAAADPQAAGIVGADRYQTAAKTASTLFTNPKTVGLATGQAFPDALTAVGQLGQLEAPILLTRPNTLPTATAHYLSAHNAGLESIDVYGGPAAVSDQVAAAAKQAARQ